MLSIPAALDELGVSQELKAALQKLAAALPAARRQDEELVRQRIYLDWSGWSQPEEPAPLQNLPQVTDVGCRMYSSASSASSATCGRFDCWPADAGLRRV